MDKVLERLKVLIDSSTPIVVMETVEEVRAVRMVRAACSALNLAVFEWTIATGLARCGTKSSHAIEAGAFDPGGYQTCASKSSVKPEVDRAREEVVKDAVPRVAGVSPIDCLHFLFRQRAGAVVGGMLLRCTIKREEQAAICGPPHQHLRQRDSHSLGVGTLEFASRNPLAPGPPIDSHPRPR